MNTKRISTIFVGIVYLLFSSACIQIALQTNIYSQRPLEIRFETPTITEVKGGLSTTVALPSSTVSATPEYTAATSAGILATLVADHRQSAAATKAVYDVTATAQAQYIETVQANATATLQALFDLPAPNNGEVYLSEFDPLSANGPFPLGVGVFTITEGPVSNGRVLSFQGTEYPHGLFTHAPFKVSFRLDQVYSKLQTSLILFTYRSCISDGAIFRVIANGSQVYQSDLITAEMSPVLIDISINASVITLQTLPGPSGNQDCDWAIWGDPILIP